MPYPRNVLTISDAVAKILATFNDDSLRVTDFTFNTTTPGGGTVKMKWNHLNVGQQAESVAEFTDHPHPTDTSFDSAIKRGVAQRQL